MSSNLMDTEKGGEQTQYEGISTDTQAHKKSTGQLGQSSDNTTTDPRNTSEDAERQAERGERTTENIRYGQTISEGGMGGVTKGQEGKVEDEGFGRVEDRGEEGDANGSRQTAGYGGSEDMDRNVGG